MGAQIAQPAPRVADAARPASGVAGAAFGEPAVRIAYRGRKKIRNKWLRLLNSLPGNRRITGRGNRRLHNGHRVSGTFKDSDGLSIVSRFVLCKGLSLQQRLKTLSLSRSDIIDFRYIAIYIVTRCDTDSETVQTVVSPNPMTWRIAVTGGIIIIIIMADGVADGRSTTANFASSHWP